MNIEKFSCGCEIWREGTTFYLRSCGDEVCYVLREVHTQSNLRGNKIIHMKEKAQ